jgi:hypothetical protein
MGDQLRASLKGPRELEDLDFRNDEKPKVVRNQKADIVNAAAHHEPLVNPTEFEKLQVLLDKRAGSQRGKPRSRDSSNNPLGGRVYDMNCGWPMYRQPCKESFRYLCGYYDQSHGAYCTHNHVNGDVAARFVNACIRQKLSSNEQLSKLEARIADLIAEEKNTPCVDSVSVNNESEIRSLQMELQTISANMARSKTDEQFRVISEQFDLVGKRIESLRRESVASKARGHQRSGLDEEVASAMDFARRLLRVSESSSNYAALGQLFAETNARLFLRFKEVTPKKRTIIKLAGGEVTLGNKPPPVRLYEGPTGRRKLALANPSNGGLSVNTNVSDTKTGQEDESLGNCNRGERI